MEGFFQNGSSLDLIEVEELLLYRYHNIEYVLNLDVNEGILLINKALEERDNQKIWDIWLAKLPYMGKNNFISFSDFKDRLKGTNIDTRSTDEILNEIDEIEAKFREKVN